MEHSVEFLPDKKIGVGLYSLSGVYGEKSQKKIKRMLMKAIELGVDFFDVADSYGDAEKVLGEVMRDFNREEVIVASKFSLQGISRTDNLSEYIKEACQRSLENLQTGYLDLYQLHYDNPSLPVSEILQGLEDLRGEGLIKEYGLGHLSPERIEEFSLLGSPATIILEMSPVATERYRKVLPLCEKYNLKIVTHGSTGRGLLTGKLGKKPVFEPGDIRNFDPLFRYGMFNSSLRVLDRIKALAQKYEVTPVQIALFWNLSQNMVGRVLVGPSSVAHLEEDLKAGKLRLEDNDLFELNSFILEEEKRRKKERERDIKRILTRGPKGDRVEIAADLIYAIDGLVEEDEERAETLLPLFKEILAWAGSNGEDESLPERIRNRLSSFLD